MNATTTYDPSGAVTTRTDGGQLPLAPSLPGAGQVDPNFMRMIQDLIKARQGAANAAPAGVSRPMMPAGVNAGQSVRRPSATPGVSNPSAVDPLAGMRAEAEAANLQAQYMPAPQRMTTFASNANNGYMPDVNAYTGAQRRAFLPTHAVPGNLGLG